MNLEELAHAAGMTTRNVRAYQSRGLIAKPTRKGRFAQYSQEHLQRLRQIEQARLSGATLNQIERYVRAGGALESLVAGLDPTGRRLGGGASAGPVAEPVSEDRLAVLTRLGVLRQDGDRHIADLDLAEAIEYLQAQGLSDAQALEATVRVARSILSTGGRGPADLSVHP